MGWIAACEAWILKQKPELADFLNSSIFNVVWWDEERRQTKQGERPDTEGYHKTKAYYYAELWTQTAAREAAANYIRRLWSNLKIAAAESIKWWAVSLPPPS